MQVIMLAIVAMLLLHFEIFRVCGDSWGGDPSVTIKLRKPLRPQRARRIDARAR